MSEISSGSLAFSVGIIITVDRLGSHAEAAISSALHQTQWADEILVVDAGSDNSIAPLLSGFRNARHIRCKDANLATVRNLGIKESNSDCLLFLGANDILLPTAVEIGRHFLDLRPELDLAVFDFEWTDRTGEPAWPSGRKKLGSEDLFLHLLAGDFAFSHSAVFYRRRVFNRIGQFQPGVAAASDRDLLLRAAAQGLSIGANDAVVAKCISSEVGLKETFLATCASLKQLDLAKHSREYSEMRRRGIAAAEDAYGGRLWERVRKSARQRRWSGPLVNDLWEASLSCPRLVARELNQFARNSLGKRFYRLATAKQKQVYHLRALARLQQNGAKSVSTQFGFDRGQPIDRYYIEQFLSGKSAAIQGRVLEVKNNDYTLKFGGARVTQSDVLHPDANCAEATIHANLTDACAFESDIFDCVILTQTLHLIYDMRAALRTVAKILKPEGTLLITTPCLSKFYHLNEPSHLKLDQDSWRMTSWSFRKLLGEFFPAHRVEVSAAGNLAANTAFLYGLAIEDLPPGVLDADDADNEMILLATATK